MVKFEVGRESRNRFLGGGNSNIFGIFTPKIGEDGSNLTVAYFSDGWFNHQRPVCLSPLPLQI